MSDKAILDGHKVVPCDLMTWTKWFGTSNRIVAKTSLGVAEVSTVFLGLDHRFGEGEPLWFETMVFGGVLGDEQDHYTTWEEAEKGHAEMVARVEQAELNRVAP